MGVEAHFLYQQAEVVIWKMEETESFYAAATGLTSLIKADKRRIEYYAGRYVLQSIIPHLDLNTIKIDDIGKPYLSDGSYQFSISHSYPYVAVVVHPDLEVGIDIQMYRDKIVRLQSKFLSATELNLNLSSVAGITLLWNAKEAMYKWRATGGQDFSDQLQIITVATIAPNDYKLECCVKDPDGTLHPINIFGKTMENYSWAVAVGSLWKP